MIMAGALVDFEQYIIPDSCGRICLARSRVARCSELSETADSHHRAARTEHLLRKWISGEKRARHGEERDGYRR
jgi:hypothetical protein